MDRVYGRQVYIYIYSGIEEEKWGSRREINKKKNSLFSK